MTTTTRRKGIEVGAVERGRQAEPAFQKIGDCVIARLDETLARRRWCPDHLVHLQDRPFDPDDAVAMLRWALAWRLDLCRVDTIARRVRVDAGRLMAFLEAPARRAGELLTLAEAARLMRLLEERIVERDLLGELDDYREIAEPYIEIAGVHIGRAIRQAKQARRAWRAAQGPAVTLR
jgi:hypothetical protein